MNIQRTVIQQVLLYKFDEIPIHYLLSNVNGKQFMEIFEFGNAEAASDPDGKMVVRFQAGNLRNENRIIPITKLAIEERRILLTTQGRSEEADIVMSKVRDILIAVYGTSDDRFLLPIVKAEESEIIARLEFPASRLLAPAFLQFVDRNADSLSYSGLATANVAFSDVTFAVHYHPNDSELSSRQITLNRKEFSIGTRPGTLPDEQIYLSKAPVDSTSHVQMLEELEKKLA